MNGVVTSRGPSKTTLLFLHKEPERCRCRDTEDSTLTVLFELCTYPKDGSGEPLPLYIVREERKRDVTGMRVGGARKTSLCDTVGTNSPNHFVPSKIEGNRLVSHHTSAGLSSPCTFTKSLRTLYGSQTWSTICDPNTDDTGAPTETQYRTL